MCQTCELVGGFCGNCDGSYWTTTTTTTTTTAPIQLERHTKCLKMAEESASEDDRRFWEAVASYVLKN